MSLKAGIIGLPNVGKSTLFKAITKQNVLAENYPFATIDPNVGVVTVPDERIEFLVQVSNPEKTIPTTVEFTDIAGLVEGASKGEGLGNKFLSNIRETDAICEVVRCFSDPNVTHVSGSVNPIRDIEVVGVELMLSDLEIINNRLSRVNKKSDKESIAEKALLEKIRISLEAETPIRNMELSDEEKKLIKSFNLLTMKKIIYVCNINEEEIGTENENVKKVKEYAKKENSEVLVLSAKIEADLSELEDSERIELLKELGIDESGLDRLIRKVYNLLGLKTFFTIGKEEVKAWTFKDGMKAPECAGIIHTDFQKGFIKAEVISYDDLFQHKTEKAVQDAGKKRLEGKDYIMKDGDICHFRFNV